MTLTNMKKISLYFLGLAVALFGCQQESLEPIGKNMKTVTLTADMVLDTKASIDSKTGYFKWQEGDVISVLATDNKFYDFTLKTGAGDIKAKFSGTIPVNSEITTVATYPAFVANGTENSVLEGTTFNYTLPTEWTWKQDVSNVPMVASFAEGADGMSFKQVGGVLRFHVKNMPAKGSVVLTTDASITGQFPVDITGLGTAAMVATEGASTLTINYSAETNGADVEFSVPVPTGTYKDYKFEVKDQSGKVLLEKTYVKENKVERAYLVNLKEVALETTTLAAPTVWPYFVDARVLLPKVEGATQYAVFVDDAEPQIVTATDWDAATSSLVIGGDFDHYTTHTVSVAKVVNGAILTATKSPAVEFTTGRVFQMTYNTGTKFVCAAWDDVALGVENSTVYDEATQKWSMVPQKDPTSRTYRGYRVRLYDENMTLLYEEVPFSSQVDYGGGMSDSSWIGMIGGKNVLLPTSLTFGWLEPGKTYYFQVQTLAEPVTFSNSDLSNNNKFRCFEANCAGHTIASARGGCGWSKLVAMTTDAPHVAGPKEVFYEGFDDMMFNSDIMNMSVALVPEFVTSAAEAATYKSTASADLYKAWVAKPFSERRFSEQGFNTMLGVFYHGLTDDTAPVASAKTYFNSYAGSLKGWSIVNGDATKPARTMNPNFGSVRIGESGGNSEYVTLRTTPIDSRLLDNGPKKCRVTIKVAGHATKYQYPMTCVRVNYYHPGNSTVKTDYDFSSSQDNSWQSSTDYIHYPRYGTIVHELELYNGDEIGFEKLVKKNTIAGNSTTQAKQQVGCLTIGAITPSFPSTPVPAARRRRTGRRCFTE